MTKFSKSQNLREVWVFSDAGAFCRANETRRHEMGHPLRLGNTTSAACRDIKSIMYVGDERRLPRGWAVQGADCDSAEREFEIDNPLDCDGDDSDHPDCQDDCTGDGEESGSSSILDVDENGMLVFVGNRSSTSSTCPAPANPCEENPDLPTCGDACDLDPDLPQCQPDCEANPSAEGCPVDCSRQPSHPDCDCSVNPDIPCPIVETCDGLWNDLNGNGRIDDGESIPNAYAPIPDGGGRRTGRVSLSMTGSSGAAYWLTLRSVQA